MNPNRIREIKSGNTGSGPVVYWMSRDQRAHDNWSLIFAQEQAVKYQKDLIVVFNLVTEFLGASFRQFKFMIEGLAVTEKILVNMNIYFKLLKGNPEETIPAFVKEVNAHLLVTDFDPLRIKLNWKRKTAKNITIPFYEVDSHNIIPCWIASGKREFSAGTFRPKVNRLLNEYLEEFPILEKMDQPVLPAFENKWDEVLRSLKQDSSPSIDWIIPGEDAALDKLDEFINYRLPLYGSERNDPSKNMQSDLSPYIHFGNIASQRIALNILHHPSPTDIKEPFLEELIVRKELSDNYCYYNSEYDSFSGFPEWAKKTLDQHRSDKREFVYTTEEFETSATHDELWNAAQREMVTKGKMHGYLRMYWAKKILEWTKSPEEALEISIYLNDKYELDGRDPNGYTGIAWSIGGVHDRAWGERDIFGKIRYMNYNGMKRKFNIKEYIRKNSG